MSGFSNYILSIAGIILISIVVELVISEGALSKHIKSIFSFFTLAVIIAPLPTLLAKDNLSSVFEFSEYELQEGYIYTLNNSRLETMAKEEELFLQGEGYNNVKILFTSSNMTEADMVIDGVKVNITEIEFLENAKYKDIDGLVLFMNDRYVKEFDIKGEKIVYER